MKKTALLLASVMLAVASQAQISVTGSSLNYSQDFNTLDTANTNSSNLPNGWAIYEKGTSSSTVNNQYKGSDGSSNSGETYSYGTAGATDRALGSLASGSNTPSYGAVFTNNTGATIDTFNLTYQGEQWRRGSNSVADSLVFFYSLNATGVNDTSATWTYVSALTLYSINNTATNNTAIDGNLNNTSVSGKVNVNWSAGNTLVIKWYDMNIPGSDDGLAIDDLSMSFTTTSTPSYNPVITALSPADNSANVAASTNNLQITFDRNVSLGSGTVTVFNETDQTSQAITVNATNVTLAGQVATINGVTLALGKAYHVTFDSSAFDTAGQKCSGIYDTTSWNFSTQFPASPSLSQNFDASCPAGLPAGWSKFSVTGAQEWTCHSYGYNNTPAMSMNGYAGGNNVNEDWLITPQLDLSAMPNPSIEFRAFKKFAGDDIHVMVSNNYIGNGDPNAAAWTDLNIDFSTVDTNWNVYTGSLATQATSPLYIAFKYTSSATDGAQWKIDNVEAKPMFMSVFEINKNSLNLAVLGTASHSEMTLGMNVKNGSYQLSIFDLAGRKVYTEQLLLHSGKQQKTISGFNLANGMYIIKLDNGKEMGTSKMIVQ